MSARILNELTDQQRQRAEALIEWAFSRTDEATAKIIWQEDRLSELKSINAELYEALDLMLQRYGYETCEYVQKSQTALAKARGES